MDNLVCTPHIGDVPHDEVEIQFVDIFDRIKVLAAGNPSNVVSPKTRCRMTEADDGQRSAVRFVAARSFDARL
jgi:phosphoglycerate dehydrogenase-like enzyme